jgi:hypothetical protein
MTILRVVVLGVAGCVAGCLALGGSDDRPGEGTAAQGQTGGSNDCEMSTCGNSNSPEIDHLGVHDFDLMGVLANDNGFRIASYSKDGRQYRPVVDKAKLTGRDLKTDTIVLDGGGTSATSLVGSRFLVVNDKTGAEYRIQIDGVDSAPYWANPTSQPMTTPTYLVNWVVLKGGVPQGDSTNICRSPPADTSDTFGMNRFHVVLFEGDRISAQKKEVYKVDNRWFNIGCASHALSKQHLFGHTQGAMDTDAHFTTTLNERTAHLKMLAADYCGAGIPLTMTGQPLNWRDDRGWFPYAASMSRPPTTPALEARWSASGATCLNQPRIAAHQTAESARYFPDIEVAIKDACTAAGRSRPPACTGPESEFFGNHILSANP